MRSDRPMPHQSLVGLTISYSYTVKYPFSTECKNVLNARDTVTPKLLNMYLWGQAWVSVRRPVSLLFLLYVCWKAILFVVILCSPGPGYDTSTTLLDLTDSEPNHQIGLLSISPTLPPP